MNTLTIPVKVETDNLEYRVGLGVAVQIVDGEHYTGPYEVEPSEYTQILETADLLMDDKVVVNPIPSNYGLITWNGVTLIVS